MFPLTTSLDPDSVSRLIRSAFPSEPFRGKVIGDSCTCDECTGVEKDLFGKSWDELTDEIIETQFGSLSLLSVAALQSFLPAWLIGSLNHFDKEGQKIRAWTIYTLALYHEKGDDPNELQRNIDRLRKWGERLTPGQVSSIRAFLTFIRDRAAISDWDRESIDRTLDLVWL